MAIGEDSLVTETPAQETLSGNMIDASEEFEENPRTRRFSSTRGNSWMMTPLLPPFLQSKSFSDESAGKKISGFQNGTGHGSYRTTSASAEKSSSLTNQSNWLQAQGLYDHSTLGTQRLLKEADESDEYPSSSYQEGEGSSDQVESDKPKTSVDEKKDPLWWLASCKTQLSSQDDQDESVDLENTTEPYLAHKLYIPYEEIPKPRFFYPKGGKVPYVSRSLPKRARSPVREMLSDKFDLEAARDEWCRKMEPEPNSEYLEHSRERMSSTLRDSMAHNVDLDTIISSIVLQAICEQVSLTIDLNFPADIGGAVDIDAVLALTELDKLDSDMVNDEQRRMSWELRHFYPPDDDEFPVPGKIPGYRRLLLTAYRSKFSRFFCPMMHRRLPWCYVSPVHQRGQTSCYTNARERIDEVEPSSVECSMAYVSDVTCPHAQLARNKSYVAYKRRSKAYSLPELPMFGDVEDLFLSMVTYTCDRRIIST